MSCGYPTAAGRTPARGRLRGIVLFMIAAWPVLALTGCGTAEIARDVHAAPAHALEAEAVGVDALSEEAQKWLDQLGDRAGARAFAGDGRTDVVVTAGMRMTGGYALEPLGASAGDDGTATVDVLFVKPGPDAIVTQVAGRPVLALRIARSVPNVVIRLHFEKGDRGVRLGAFPAASYGVKPQPTAEAAFKAARDALGLAPDTVTFGPAQTSADKKTVRRTATASFRGEAFAVTLTAPAGHADARRGQWIVKDVTWLGPAGAAGET